MRILYDPPSGWQYGFPKQMPSYSETDPDANEKTILKMLEKANYPKKDFELALKYGRFILIDEKPKLTKDEIYSSEDGTFEKYSPIYDNVSMVANAVVHASKNGMNDNEIIDLVKAILIQKDEHKYAHQFCDKIAVDIFNKKEGRK